MEIEGNAYPWPSQEDRNRIGESKTSQWFISMSKERRIPMPKQMKNKPKVKSEATLHREEKLIDLLLPAFSSNGVRALMVLEKQGKVLVNGTDFHGGALLLFLVDLFLRYPELYTACTEMIRDKV